MPLSSRIEQLHEQAAGLVGLKDFGSDDGYLDGLNALIDAVEAEAELTEVGQQMFAQQLIGGLVGRLLAEKGFTDHPQCLAASIKKPIIVTGFTRSGTTALHKLLVSVPGTQGLDCWLTAFPMPRPPREIWDGIPAYQQTVTGLEQLYTLAPDMKKIHLIRADEPDECWRIFTHSFMTYSLLGFVWAPPYADWLLTVDRRKAYARYRKVMQLIGYQNASTWVLKDPMHLPSIDLVLEQFPDACIVHTCREPVEVMPSVCSLMNTVTTPFQNNIDKHQYGRRIFSDYAWQMERFMELRKKLDPGRFLDVQYNDIVRDPVTVAKNIYRHFDIDIGAPGEQALQRWQQENTQHKFGKHEYRLEDFGLSQGVINERLANYRQTYLQRN